MKTRIARDVAAARRPGRPISADMGTAGVAQAEADRARIRTVLRAPSDWRAPAPVPRLTRHDMSVPTHDAAQACRSELMQWGALAVEISKAADGTVWQVQASFPELVPDPSYARRVAQLQDLAAEQGGEYHGSGH